MTTQLGEKIAARIAADGPISIADYMAQCLLDPAHGYYVTREPFGPGGDFITAPEISQLFGEIVGAFMIHAWQQAGRPAPFTLCELGPGRGTLMADILRTARIDPQFDRAARPALVEASARLRAIQRATLGDHAGRVRWVDRIDDLEDAPLFLVANEFFDALPVHQFVKTARGWRERLVTTAENGSLAFAARGAMPAPDLLPSGHHAAATGSIFEHAPSREAVAEQIGARLAGDDGVALIIDYGHAQTGFGDTLQAVRNHGFADPLAQPGLADLTSHVDFAALAASATRADARALPVMTQARFLLHNGILERAGALGAGKPAAEQEAIRSAIERLCGDRDDQMGELFKMLVLTGRSLVRPLAPLEAAG